jgi:heme/copper-type cytochrome/quinol oxidase subunit 1
MPLLTRTMIKTGLIYFVIALLMGALVIARPVLNLPAEIAAFQPVYLHLLMVGWVTQLIMGVVYWMFPKESKERPRGNEKLGWAVFALLNAGLILRAVGEPLIVIDPALNAGWILAVSAVLQLLAGWGFIFNTWARVKER